jgi:hypothetical protein
MSLFFTTLLLITFGKTLYGGPVSESLIQSHHLHYRTVGNPNLPLEYDCARRAFTIEMAAYIAPESSKTNWTTLSQSAFQMNQCNNISNTNYQPSSSAKPFKTSPEMKKGACHHTIFVHDSKGNDLFDGTFEKPMKTIQAALSVTRALRNIYSNDNTLCTIIRGGTYYLGTNATTSSSQIGVIALTSNDSNIVIENYQTERVVLSGGTLLQLQWSVHAKTADGSIIMKDQVPDFVKLDQFNELYIDGRRAIVAKYPNGDPSTKGLYANDTGFSYDSQSWKSTTSIPGADIHVLEPNHTGTPFPNYHLTLGGRTSVFNPPRSFWGGYGVSHGFTVKKGGLPHLREGPPEYQPSRLPKIFRF